MNTPPDANLPLVFPRPGTPGTTRLVLLPDPDGGLPLALHVGPVDPADLPALATAARANRQRALLPEHRRGDTGSPGLAGHRLAGHGPGDAAQVPAGRDWTPFFRTRQVSADDEELEILATDPASGLALCTRAQALPGGSLRVRHELTNTGTEPYLVDRLEVALPVPTDHTEVLDFTGRWARERVPQRRPLTDGTWVREMRGGRSGHDGPLLSVLGTPGFGFGTGAVLGVHVAWSGNAVVRVERLATEPTTVLGGELLLPGELVLAPGEAYRTPWVHVLTAPDGLDSLAASAHRYQRSLPAHPRSPRPVNLNVWEAVYFDHDLTRLTELVALAAEVGAERFVLDDGWFRHRRDDDAGLGDWFVDEQVWPRGLAPLVDEVRRHGLVFGLWFEPEMVNPDSDLFRAHPDWVLSADGRLPRLQRNQLVLDLSRPEVVDYLLARIDTILSEYEIGYVKWDHNRALVEAGSAVHGGAPAVHRHTQGFLTLWDELRRRHPAVEWEGCASGGGRIDLDLLSRCQRVWTSDMTDALARQPIQRWTTQLVAPEYLGAHVSANRSHQTGRVLPLDFRAATALFGHFGIEWDLTEATAAERAQLADWIALYKRHRDLLHSGRVVRLDEPDPALWTHGVVAPDRRSALMARVQLDESARLLPCPLRVPGLDPTCRYRLRWAGPAPLLAPRVDGLAGQLDLGPAGGESVSGAALATIGVPVPNARPETVTLVHVEALDG